GYHKKVLEQPPHFKDSAQRLRPWSWVRRNNNKARREEWMNFSFATLLRSLGLITAVCGAAPSSAAGVDELPKAIQEELYSKDMMDPAQPIGESAYRDWKPKRPPPWTIGYASSYAGNTWRADVMNRLQNTIIPKWKKL